MSSKQTFSVDESNENEFSGEPIQKPHRHDVLSGRGNSYNNHPGNEYFRSLIKLHKVSYVTAPKSQKPDFSKMIYEIICSQDPPGRFLKQDKKTNLWYEISYRKAVDKTRQALREGAPDIKQKISFSSVLHSAATVDGRRTTKPDLPIICATNDTQMMIQNSSTSDLATQMAEKIQQLQRQLLQNQQELMQARQEYATIGTVTNSNEEPLMNQQQLMASMYSSSDILSFLMDPSFTSSTFQDVNEELSDSSKSIGQLGENKNDSVALSNNVAPLLQLPLTISSLEQQQQEPYATQHSNLSPPSAMIPASEEANIQQLHQQNYFMKSGDLLRYSQMEERSSEVNFMLKESNCNSHLTHIRGLPREHSLCLGNIIVTEEKSISMDEIDSVLSKMLEISLDLDAVLSKQE